MKRQLPLAICGLVLCYSLAMVGCEPQQGEFAEYQPEGEVTDPHDHDHAHEHGPHDGHLVELGDEEYHAELVLDSGKLTVYILDSAGENAVAIDQPEVSLNLTTDGNPTQLKLAAAPMEGEAEGQSSRFEIAADQLPDGLDDVEELEGKLAVTIQGTSYNGEIAHDHDHDHDHEHEDHE